MTNIVEQKENGMTVIPAGAVAIPNANPGQMLMAGNGGLALPPFWDSAGDIFNKHGLGLEQKRTGFLTLITLNSAPLGYPLASVLIDHDGSQAADLMNLCVSMVPEKSVMPFPSLDPKILSRGGTNFEGKAIVGSYNPRSQKISGDLLTLLQGWMVPSPPGPVSWLMTINQPDETILSTPLILKLHLASDRQSLEESLAAIVGMVQSQTDYEMAFKQACMKKFFGRLSPRTVIIPFGKQLIGSLRSDISNLRGKFIIFIKLLKIISIINNAPPITLEEISKDYVGIPHPPSIFSNPGLPPLQASKVDYYHLWVLMDGIIPGGGDDLLTPKQKRIFVAIRERNLICLDNKFMTEAEKQSEAEILKMIASPSNSPYWADKDGIWRSVNQDGGEKISLPNLDTELVSLIQLKIISQQKAPDNACKICYYVNMLDIDYGDKLPHPSEINDPNSQGNHIQVTNPLTGEVEQI